MKRPSIRRLLTWLIFAALAGLAVYKLKFAPAPVVAHTVVRGEIVAEVMGTGTLEARVKTTISPRIQERLAEVLVDQGDTVKAGQLLARLDDAESKMQVDIAEAALAGGEANCGAGARRRGPRGGGGRTRRGWITSGLPACGRPISSQADADKAAEAVNVAEADVKRSHAAIAEAEALMVMAEKNLLFREERLAFTRSRARMTG